MNTAYPWTCPFCGREATITDRINTCSAILRLDKANAEGQPFFRSLVTICPNPNVRKFTLEVYEHEH
jgi:hypothetical protein